MITSFHWFHLNKYTPYENKPSSGHALVDLVHLVSGQAVASLLNLCMTKMTAQMAMRLTLRSFKPQNRKVPIVITSYCTGALARGAKSK